MNVKNKKNSVKIIRQFKRPKLSMHVIWLCSGVLLVIGVIIWVLFFSGNIFSNREGVLRLDAEKLTIIVPWNAGNLADKTVRALTDSEIRNVSGSNGAVGINEVYDSPLDGLNILGTNLSSIITSQLTGFTESNVDDWEYWFTAFSPCVVAVRSDSGYLSLDDLLSASELTVAHAGGGTLSYIAAHMLSEQHGITFTYMEYPGTNPAINDILDGAADFIIAPRSDMISFLNSGELREIKIDPVFARYFGEWYGFMLPKRSGNDILLFYDKFCSEITSSERFLSFTTENGMLPEQPNRKTGREIALSLANIIEKVLLESGYLKK